MRVSSREKARPLGLSSPVSTTVSSPDAGSKRYTLAGSTHSRSGNWMQPYLRTARAQHRERTRGVRRPRARHGLVGWAARALRVCKPDRAVRVEDRIVGRVERAAAVRVDERALGDEVAELVHLHAREPPPRRLARDPRAAGRVDDLAVGVVGRRKQRRGDARAFATGADDEGGIPAARRRAVARGER